MKFFIVAGCFILFDILTGIIKAIKEKNLDSTHLREGLFHKLGELLALGGAYLFEASISYVSLGFELPLLDTTAIYICVMESVSCIENICIIYPPLKKLFQPYLAKLKDVEGEE